MIYHGVKYQMGNLSSSFYKNNSLPISYIQCECSMDLCFCQGKRKGVFQSRADLFLLQVYAWHKGHLQKLLALEYTYAESHWNQIMVLIHRPQFWGRWVRLYGWVFIHWGVPIFGDSSKVRNRLLRLVRVYEVYEGYEIYRIPPLLGALIWLKFYQLVTKTSYFWMQTR